MPEILIHTDFGEIKLAYEDESDLKKKLEDLPNHMELVSDAFVGLVRRDKRIAKPGYENTYRFAPTGSVELLVVPGSKVEAAALVLYASYPEPLDIDEIKKSTANPYVASGVLNQTNNKIYFVRDGDKYSLSVEGVQFVVEKYPPQIDQIDKLAEDE